jgi:hypothetical protein
MVSARVPSHFKRTLTPTAGFKATVNKNTVDLTVTETNSNGRRCKQKWVDVTEDEVWISFDLVIFTGPVQYPKISD